ncbi:uncharacterized protein [Littorina saxatilis]|uniref:uncharacterized protein n=1 Tax=Littorina saxatilis TaxID=31220 RepID=UPI0038B60F66
MEMAGEPPNSPDRNVKVNVSDSGEETLSRHVEGGGDSEEERVVDGGGDRVLDGGDAGGEDDDAVEEDRVGDSGDSDRHDAVEADYTPVGSADPMVESGIEMDPSDEEDIGDTTGLSGDQRNELFARGLSHEKEGKIDVALRCYLGCLAGLTQHTRFVLLPQCLRNIAEIYYQNQEYDKAIHFIQAEKLYYENALISTEEIQKKLEELNVSQADRSPTHNSEFEARTLETMRAEEYEHLAKLCMDKDQPQLALEYAGKCTKLRQRLFGEHHPKTQDSLDFFATVYAEVGKQQYNDSLGDLDSPLDDDPAPFVSDSESSAPTTPTGDGTPVSILRQRKRAEREKKQVRFHESVVDNTQLRQQEEWVSRTVVVVLLLICCFFLTILGLGLYCRVIDSNLCGSMVQVARDAYLNVRYQYYKYTSTKHVKFA